MLSSVFRKDSETNCSTCKRQTEHSERNSDKRCSTHSNSIVLCILILRTDHVEELAQNVQRDVKLSLGTARKQRRHRETRTDGGEVIVWVHSTTIREIGAWRERVAGGEKDSQKRRDTGYFVIN